MKNISKEYHDYIVNGPGKRTKDQITILKSYAVFITDISIDAGLKIIGFYTDAYHMCKTK